MRSFAHGCGLLLSLFIYTSIAHSQLIEWNDTIPSSLTVFQQDPQQLASLALDNIVIFAQPSTQITLPTKKDHPKQNVQFVSAAVVLPVSTQDLAKVLTDYSHYVGLFPTIKSAKVEEASANVSRVKYKVQIPTPIPVLNFNENVTMQHQLGKNSLASLMIDSPVPYSMGKFEWFSLGPQKTLLTLTQWSDLNQIKGFVLGKILSTIPDVKLGAPVASNVFILESLQQKWKKPQIKVLNIHQLPSPQLSPAQVQKISQISRNTGYPVSFIQPICSVPYPHGTEPMRFTTSYQYYPQTPQQLQKWLHPDSFQTLFPRQIKKVELSSMSTHVEDASFRVTVGLGIINIPFNFKMRFEQPDVGQSDFTATGGDLRFVKGSMQTLAQPSGSLFKMTSAAKIDAKAPFLLRAMRSLPYHDILPAASGNTIFSLKIKEKMK
ncbi:hypothetical protein [Acinetobacter baylyi]|uniref:SRPBCC family protein n=1 Tax=Acinetobacter baylyi (strain ATCC 33305 / BD413 / ADP1) TaxID=62977 RepID=Q6F7V3_ACIAD|nr:hypothetical protein [Acinetobacter baylyi]ENV55162.1 hypothetical protein F952_00887 [Acinetobacter baylyi DSM 14961 = CIP 107474]KAF2369322.1 hypothetical protein BSL88_16425 [Acinetobacter baylyi]KAF2372834.1 hypothetical protein BSL67_12185 [Acinetobacter baylyi]KAF2375551.1 hypothetical protein BSN81_15950 [Acinetobacter baylyi]KAF2379918.1 hypothetical protein BSN83_13215 [Acinetobacter baylyi]